MATTSEARALPFFTDLLGQPLQAGFIYIGQPGLDPVAYPAVVTSDIAGTTVVAQPVRTTNGHAAAAGALIHLFVQIPYSITILDSAGRLVYASLNETDPVAVAIGSSSVQSAPDLATLRARSGSSTNQVWVAGYGMYIYNPIDNTSPESIPTVIVGNDGSRYQLSQQYVSSLWTKAQGPAPANSQGVWLSWNDDATGRAYLTNNEGLGSGGITFRTVNAAGTTVIGNVAISATGDIAPDGSVTAGGNVTAKGGIVAVSADGTKQLNYDGVRYNLPAASLNISGSPAITAASFPATTLANQTAHGIGAVTLGTATMPSPGTWVLDSTINSVYLWVRTA